MDQAPAARPGLFVCAEQKRPYTPHPEERACARLEGSPQGACGHPSRRGQVAAPQDEGQFLVLPFINIKFFDSLSPPSKPPLSCSRPVHEGRFMRRSEV